MLIDLERKLFNYFSHFIYDYLVMMTVVRSHR